MMSAVMTNHKENCPLVMIVTSSQSMMNTVLKHVPRATKLLA